MPETPFHVASGSFVGTFERHQTLLEPKTRVSTSRRRKLWDVPHKCHCPIIGTCFAVSELRALMQKAMPLPKGTSDFVLHTAAVGACESRSRLAELLHKTLEKRHQLTIKRFAAARTAEGLRTLWQEATREGGDIPGALWAAWSHPACEPLLEQEIYGDVHMLQHQVGSGARVDLKALQALRGANAELHRLLAQARRESDTARAEKARETRTLSERIAELRAGQVGRDACIARLAAQLEQLRGSLPDLKERQALARRADDAEARATALTAHCRSQQHAIERLGRQLREAGESCEQPPPHDAAERCVATNKEALDGKCILCVGGRSGAIDAYRGVVERHGGRFLHHDGGLEESLHRIDGPLAAADLVICQAGCISHNAYWRVKEQCKRTGKPCLFVRATGISAFDRVIGEFGQSRRSTVGFIDTTY